MIDYYEKNSEAAVDMDEKAWVDADEKAAVDMDEKAAVDMDEKAAVDADEKDADEKAGVDAAEKAGVDADEKALPAYIDLTRTYSFAKPSPKWPTTDGFIKPAPKTPAKAMPPTRVHSAPASAREGSGGREGSGEGSCKYRREGSSTSKTTTGTDAMEIATGSPQVYGPYSDCEDPDIVLEVYGTADHAWTNKMEHEDGDFTDCHAFTQGRDWSDKSNHKCSGNNGYLLMCLASDPVCWEVLKDAKQKLTPELHDIAASRGRKKKRKPHHHGLRCDHGRHRSTGIAVMIRYILMLRGFHVNIKYLSTVPCGCPSNCKKMRGNPSYKEKQQAEWSRDGSVGLAFAERIWRRCA